MDERTLRREASSQRIPPGTTDMTADGGTLWLVGEQSNTLTHLDGRTGRVLGAPASLPPGDPFAVAVDGNAASSTSPSTATRRGSRTSAAPR